MIEVNGEPRDLPSPVTIKEFVEGLSLAPERLAIELNRRVVRRADWPQTMLAEGDRLEIVHFVGGGSQFSVLSFEFSVVESLPKA